MGGKNAKQVDAVPTALEVRARRIHGLKPVATEILPRWGKVCALPSRDATKTRGKHFPQRLKCLPTPFINHARRHVAPNL